MESQVAFMRNMVIPLLALLFWFECYFTWFEENCWTCMGKIIFCILMLWTIYLKQNKIYRRVWEDYIFLKRLEKSNR